MSTRREFVDYIAEQAALGERFTCRRMFGEYGLYIDGKVVAFACDDSLFVKPAEATAGLCADLPRRPPYPGAKLYPVADELLDDSERLQTLLLATFAAVGEGKAVRTKKAVKKSPAVKKTPATKKSAVPRKPRATQAS